MKRFAWVGLFALVLAAAIPAGASTFLAMSQKELVAQSDAVVLGDVLQINSFWSPSGRIVITEAMVRVEETIAGEAPTVLILKTFGGTVGGFTVNAEGFPEFNVGDRLLLFVQNQADGTVEVTGYRQGQFRVFSDRGIQKAVPTLESGVRLLNRDGRLAPRPAAVELEAFKSQIRNNAGRAGRLAN